MKMINDHSWLWMALVIIIYIMIIFSTGCASDPVPPIQAYRQQYGFPVMQ
jgi:HNH endonuclease